jgi:hypothetical protein
VLASLPSGLVIPPLIPPANSGCAERKADEYGHSIQHVLYFSIICGSEWTDVDDYGQYMAEGEGFEPPVPFQAQRFSRPPVSTAHPSLRVWERSSTHKFIAPSDSAPSISLAGQSTRKSAQSPCSDERNDSLTAREIRHRFQPNCFPRIVDREFMLSSPTLTAGSIGTHGVLQRSAWPNELSQVPSPGRASLSA